MAARSSAFARGWALPTVIWPVETSTLTSVTPPMAMSSDVTARAQWSQVMPTTWKVCVERVSLVQVVAVDPLLASPKASVVGVIGVLLAEVVGWFAGRACGQEVVFSLAVSG